MIKSTTLLILLFITSMSLTAQTENPKTINDSITKEINYHPIQSLEIKPEFPGGLDSLYTFIEKNNNWQVGQITMTGRVFVSFIIGENGSISNIELVKKFNPECDLEAIRIICIMPPWIPGKLNGKPVRTKLVLPILFDGLSYLAMVRVSRNIKNGGSTVILMDKIQGPGEKQDDSSKLLSGKP